MEDNKGFNIKYLVIGILFTLQTVGIYEHIWNLNPNQCEMTYMYQNPEYIPVELPKSVTSQFPQYGLYCYGEGIQASQLYAGKYSGQPVLFVPGNGGSYKQVRSLASVAYRKSMDDDESRHFDFFTADLAEDLGALYGPALEEQTSFIAAVLPIIQRLYLQKKPVILIGHSMGGLVSRAVLLSESVNSSDVSLLVTLASPHAAPPIALDPYIAYFYDKVLSYWSLERDLSGAVANIALVNVGGGRNDVQVSPLAIALPHAHVTTVTTAVPGCWATTDHLSIVWCKQLVLAVVRGLFDSVDRHTQRIHNSTSRLAAIFDYHLVTRHAGKRYVSQRHNRQMKVSSDATWVEVTKRQFEHQQPPRTQHSYVMFPLSGSPKSKYHKAVVRVRGSEEKEWVFACSTIPGGSGGKACTTGHNLSRRSRLLGGEGRAKLLEVSLPPLLLEGYTHVVVSLPPHDKWVTVSVDVHGDTERRSSVATPRLLSSFTATPALPATAPRALRHELVLEGLNEPWHSYSVLVRPSAACPVNGSAAPPQLWVTAHTSHSIARVPHRVESGQFVYRVEQDEIALLPSAASDPSAPPTRGDLTVQLLLEPSCVYAVSVRASLPGACRRLLLLYGPQLPAFLLTQLLLALAGQLKSIGTSRYCPSLIDSLLTLTPMLVVPFVKLSAMVLYKLDVYNDQQLLSDLGIDLGVLPIFLFLSWMPLTLLLSAGVWLTVLAAGHAMHSTATRIFGVSFGAGEVVAEIALTGLFKIPAVVAVALLAIAFTTCGALGIALATVFYFMQLFDMYKDYIKKVILKMIPSLSEETPPQPAAAATATTPTNSTSSATNSTATSGVTSPNTTTTSTTPTTEHPEGIVITRSVVPQSNESLALHLHLTLLVLCLVTSLFQGPTLLTWAIRTKQGALLPADPTLWPSVVCLCSLAVLWQCSPRHGGRHYVLLGHAVHAAAVLTLIFASISVYKLPYVVASIFGAMAIHQVVTGVTGFGTFR